MFQKLKHSDYPADCTSMAERQAHLDSLNRDMRFLEILGGKGLTIENVRPNATLKGMAKSCINSYIGTFTV